jgi:hypothetical protein
MLSFKLTQIKNQKHVHIKIDNSLEYKYFKTYFLSS